MTPRSEIRCPACEGQGTIVTTERQPGPSPTSWRDVFREEVCPECKGTGEATFNSGDE